MSGAFASQEPRWHGGGLSHRQFKVQPEILMQTMD